MNNKLDEIVKNLHNVKKSRGGYTCKCPSHDDKMNSLSLSEKDDRILVKCFAGCSIQDILDKMGLSIKDLFIGDEEKIMMSVATAPKLEEVKKFSSIEEIIDSFKTLDDYYIYNEQGGSPSLVQVRYMIGESKSFATYHKENGYWVSGKGEKLSPLYNIDNVTKANSILIVEGEKLVKILEKYGITATTSIGGSSNAINTDWSPLKNKKSVVIWRDNDAPGIKYQEDVCNILYDMGVNVRVVNVDSIGLNPKDDIEQFIEMQDGDIAEVRQKIINQIPKKDDEIKPTTHLKSHLAKVYNGEINNLEIPGFPMLTEAGQFFIPGSISLIYSKPGSGKSLLTQNIFDEWSITGEVRVKRLLLESSINMYLLRCLSKLSNRFDVLKYDFHENNQNESKQLIGEFSDYLDVCGSTMTTSDSQFGKKITDWTEESVIKWIRNNIKDNDVLLIDPISRILGTGKSPVWEVTNRITAEVESLLSQNPHARIVFIHHPSSDDTVSGGAGWERFSHNVVEIVKLEEPDLFEIVTSDGDVMEMDIDRYIRIKKCRSGEGLHWKIAIKMSDKGLYFEEVGKILRKCKK